MSNFCESTGQGSPEDHDLGRGCFLLIKVSSLEAWFDSSFILDTQILKNRLGIWAYNWIAHNSRYRRFAFCILSFHRFTPLLHGPCFLRHSRIPDSRGNAEGPKAQGDTSEGRRDSSQPIRRQATCGSHKGKGLEHPQETCRIFGPSGHIPPFQATRGKGLGYQLDARGFEFCVRMAVSSESI